MIVSKLRAGAAYELSNMVLLSGSSLIYSADMETGYATFPLSLGHDILQEEVMNRIVRRIRNDRIEFDFRKTVHHVGRLSQPAIPLNLIHPYNYFHFLIESLPSLLWLLDRGAIDDSFVIVSGLLHPNMSMALEHALGDKQMSVVQLRLMQAIACDRLVAGRPAAHAAQLIKGGTSDWQYNREKLELLRSRFGTFLSAAAREPRKKLYVRRVSTIRSLTNAAEVEDMVQAAGYTVVQPETMTFFEQVRLFGQASHIMGPTGAWASNLIFAPKDAVIDVFYPETARIEKAVWGAMVGAIGMKLNDIYCPVTRLLKPWAIHSDFSVPADFLKDLLRERV